MKSSLAVEYTWLATRGHQEDLSGQERPQKSSFWRLSFGLCSIRFATVIPLVRRDGRAYCSLQDLPPQARVWRVQ